MFMKNLDSIQGHIQMCKYFSPQSVVVYFVNFIVYLTNFCFLYLVNVNNKLI